MMEHSKPLDCTMATGRNAKTVAELLHRSKAMRGSAHFILRRPKMPERRRDTTTKKNTVG